MAIDWFTIGAQILNFLVLVFLLKRFLYQPVLDAIDKREKRIANALADAARSKAEAGKERDALQAKNDAFDKERATLLSTATDAAAKERKSLLTAAHKAAEAVGDKQKKALASDAKNLSAEISRRAEAEVFAIARKVLADMVDSTIEDRMSALFITKLGALEGPAKAAVVTMLTTAKGAATIRSALELPTRQRTAIHKAMTAAFPGDDLVVTYETAPELVSGIELVAGGEKLAWSISDYLKTLEKSVTELLKSKTPDAASAS